MSKKAELRKKLLKDRKAFDPAEKQSAEKKIAENVSACGEYINAEKLLIYFSTPDELSTLSLIEDALKQGREVYCPKCLSKDGEMIFCRITSFDDLEKGYFGIMEPKPYCKAGEFSENDLCIVPGLAFDLSGHRIGYGKGFYDRFLSCFPGHSMGLCFQRFITDDVFGDGFDVPVDMIFTEKGIIDIEL